MRLIWGNWKASVRKLEAQALDALLPYLADLVQETGAQPYSNAPIASKRLWSKFISDLETFSGEASVDIFDMAGFLKR
jgi:acyl-CoA oxidase